MFGLFGKRKEKAADAGGLEEALATLNALMHFLVGCLDGQELLELTASAEELISAAQSGNQDTELPMQLDMRIGVFVAQSIISFLDETTFESTAVQLKLTTTRNITRDVMRNMFDLSDELVGRFMVPIMDAVAGANASIEEKSGLVTEAELDEDMIVKASMVGRYIAAEFHSAYAKDRDAAPTDGHRALVRDMLGR